MMRLLNCAVVAAGLCLVAGCQSPVAGTWKMMDDQPAAPVTIAAMTLAEDGTFTANAVYGGADSQVMSGYYVYADGKLEFETGESTRAYDVTVEGDRMTFEHGESTVQLQRMAR